MTVGSPTSASDAGLVLAQQKGYFADVGIKMKYSGFKAGSDIIPLLASGRVDVAGLSIDAGMVNAHAGGNELQVVADKGSFSNGSEPSYGALVVKSDLAGQIKGPEDLKGKTIALGSKGSSVDRSLEAYLEQGGLTAKDVNITNLGQSERLVALEKGAAQVAFLFEPYVTQAVEQGFGKVLVDGGKIIPDQQVAVTVFGGRWAEENPEVAQRFMDAYACGVADYAKTVESGQGRDEVVKEIAEFTGEEAASLKKVTLPRIHPDAAVNTDDLNDTLSYFEEAGLVKDSVKADDLVKTEWLDKRQDACSDLTKG